MPHIQTFLEISRRHLLHKQRGISRGRVLWGAAIGATALLWWFTIQYVWAAGAP